MRRMRRDIANMNPQESNKKLATHHSWFASPLLDLLANSRTRVQNGVALLVPSRYLYLDLPEHVINHL